MQTLPSSPLRPQLVVTSGHLLRVDGLSIEHEEILCRSLRVANPAVAQQKRFSGWVSRSVPKFLTGYVREPDGSLWIAPGAGMMLWHMSQDWGYEFVWAGPEHPFKQHEFFYLGERRALQDRIVEACNKRQGAFVAPCGGGKTDVALRIIQSRAVSTLVIVHTRELVDQWRDRIEKRMGIKPFILHKIPKKPMATYPIIIATAQYLIRHGDLLADLDQHRKMVIVDECHHTPCSTFTQILSRLNPYYRFGFTATPERDDGTTALLNWWIGPVIGEIKQEELESAGLVMRPRLEVRVCPHVVSSYDPKEPGDYHRVTKLLEDNHNRQQQIAGDIADEFNRIGGTHIVLVSHVTYLERLLETTARLLVREGMVAGIIGTMGKMARRDVLRRVRAGEVKILFATTLADEGLDLPALDHAWLVSLTRAASKVQQRIGRVCRSLHGKTQPVVTAYVDVAVAREDYDQEGRRVIKRLFVNQFRHCLRKVYRPLCDVDEAQIRSVLTWRGDVNAAASR